MDNFTYQHDPRISGADFEDDDVALCPKCRTELDEYDERMDGYWCGECLKWYADMGSDLLSFDELDAMKNKEWHP